MSALECRSTVSRNSSCSRLGTSRPRMGTPRGQPDAAQLRSLRRVQRVRWGASQFAERGGGSEGCAQQPRPPRRCGARTAPPHHTRPSPPASQGGHAAAGAHTGVAFHAAPRARQRARGVGAGRPPRQPARRLHGRKVFDALGKVQKQLALCSSRGSGAAAGGGGGVWATGAHRRRRLPACTCTPPCVLATTLAPQTGGTAARPRAPSAGAAAPPPSRVSTASRASASAWRVIGLCKRRG